MSRPLGLPRNAALAILAVVIVVVFMSLAFLIPWTHEGTSGPAAASTNVADAMVAAGTSPAPAAAETVKNTIDVLKLIDPAQDAIHGDWVRDGEALKSTLATGQSQIEFPYVPPEEYDLHVTFQCGGGAMAVVCAAGGKQFVWRMGPSGLAGFALVGGQGFGGNRSTQQGVPWNQNGQPATLVFQFRRDHIDVLLNGQTVTTFQTDYQDFTLNPMYQQHRPDTLGIFSVGNITVQSAQVVEITGQGTHVR